MNTQYFHMCNKICFIIPIVVFWAAVDLNIKMENSLKWRNFNTEKIDLGSLKWNIKCGLHSN
jgi:hypothetical protein